MFENEQRTLVQRIGQRLDMFKTTVNSLALNTYKKNIIALHSLNEEDYRWWEAKYTEFVNQSENLRFSDSDLSHNL